MNRTRVQSAVTVVSLSWLIWISACGGGGSGSTVGVGPAPPQPLRIMTASPLPDTLEGQPYTTTLTAAGGQGAYHWSISPVSATTLFPNGLSIDPNTGVISGTVNFGGVAGFIAQVKDSASTPHTVSKSFQVLAAAALQVGNNSAKVTEYRDIFPPIAPNVQGGVAPLSYTLTGGSLPPGVRLDSSSGQVSGSAYVLGTYSCTVTVQDSYSPPEIGSEQLTITVQPNQFSVANSLPSHIPLNRPFSGRVIATGGIPPYTFALAPGSSLPPGLSPIDPAGGYLSGTPNTVGLYTFWVKASDSSSPPQNSGQVFSLAVVQPVGRNDTPATATRTFGGVAGSISPYMDPPNGTPSAGDNDYYKLSSLGGATVHLETYAKRFNENNPLDTVLEIVDANGFRFSTCRQPGDNTNNFTSACLNDDISSTPLVQDSALDFQVPGATNLPTDFYVHVLDWRGDARPDMTYSLDVSGTVAPLIILTTSLGPAARGRSFFQQLSSANGTGTITWSIASGSLPPGLILNSPGTITGSATTDGIYSLVLQASDSANPPQVVLAPETLQVVDPVIITTSLILPDGCVNKPYSFTPQTSGGLPPLTWTFSSSRWPFLFMQATGEISGTTTLTGSFTGILAVTDATRQGDSQQLSLTVNQCP